MTDISSILSGSTDIIQKAELEEALKSYKLRIYLGIDPTGPNIHLGHMVHLKKLKKFQELGHKIIFLIGDFTATIGDPSGHNKMREPLTKDQVVENTKDYIAQAKKIIPIDDPDNPVEVRFNSEWHDKQSQRDLIENAHRLTVQQLLERDLFQERIKNNLPISLSEFLYPYLQGYDAVKLKADLQIGGTDQTFNMLMGRDLRKKMENKIQSVLTFPLIPGTDGRKMSKSYGNTINVADKPNDMFGKLLSIPDNLIVTYFTYLTDILPEAITVIEQELTTKNPKELKVRLAKLIIEDLYGATEAEEAEAEFNRVFVDGGVPGDIATFEASIPLTIIDLLIETGLATSKSEAGRLIEQGGVIFDGEKIIEIEYNVTKQGLLQVGKRRFVNIIK